MNAEVLVYVEAVLNYQVDFGVNSLRLEYSPRLCTLSMLS